MSVWASFNIFDGEDDIDGPAPLTYRRSHVIPNPDDPRSGSFDLAYIPGFLTRDGRDDGPEEGTDDIWPYLRVSVCADEGVTDGETVVLDLAQVQTLHENLGWFLSRVKGEPR